MTATIGVREAERTERRLPVAVVTADGHSWSWIELFETFAPAIRSYARARGVRAPDDIVQEVFVVAVEKLQGFRGDPAGLRSLLFTIAYRRIADEHRRFYRRPETLVATHAPTPDTAPQVEDLVSARDTVDQAIQAFSVLDTRERHVLEMRIFQDATPAQVAESIGISSGNVRVIQSRALSKIRKHLESIGKDGASRTMATVVLFETIWYLREELPSDGLLGQWIGEVRVATANVDVAFGAGCGGAVATSAGAGVGSAATSVASTSVVASGAAKLTMIISLTAASIGGGVVATGSEPFVPIGTLVSNEVEMSWPQPGQEMGGSERVTPGSRDLVEIAPGASPIGGTGIDIEPERIAPFAPEAVDAEVGRREGPVQSVVDDVVDPLVDAVVDGVVVPLVDEVVDPLVTTVVGDVVDPLVDAVVDDVVVPLVDEVVDPLVRTVVDDVVDPLVEEVLDPLVGDLVDELELPPILGGLLGGLLQEGAGQTPLWWSLPSTSLLAAEAGEGCC